MNTQLINAGVGAGVYGWILIGCGLGLILLYLIGTLCKEPPKPYVDVEWEPRVNGGGIDERG